MQNSWTYTADLVRFADLERGAQHRSERRSCFERLVSGSSPTYFRLQQERRCALHKCRNWAGSRPQRPAQKGKVICCNRKCPLLQREVSRYTRYNGKCAATTTCPPALITRLSNPIITNNFKYLNVKCKKDLHADLNTPPVTPICSNVNGIYIPHPQLPSRKTANPGDET